MLLSLPGLGIAGEALAETPPAAVTREDVNVRDHGARGDGVAVDTAAFRKAIRDATDASPVRRVIVPRGRYVIDADNIFGDLNGTHKIGMVVQGDGRESSVLILRTGGKPKWFYNNGATARMAFPTFSDLRFETDGSASGGGFHINSEGHEQGFTFWRCRFHNMRTMLRLTGPVGNDSHRFFNCHITDVYDKVVHWENPQAVVIEFFGTNIETIYGDVFHVGKGGGGDLRVFGGSIIMDNRPDDKTPHYLLSIEPSNFVGSGNGTFQFQGIKTELRSAFSKLVRSEDGGGLGDVFVFFNGSNLYQAVGGAREAVRIGNNRRVNFTTCTLSGEFLYTLAATAAVAELMPLNGWIDFRDCRLPPGLRDKITFATPHGRARALDCHEYVVKLLAPGSRVSPDFDRRGAAGGPGGLPADAPGR